MSKQDKESPASTGGTSWREAWSSEDQSTPMEIRHIEERLHLLEGRCRRYQRGLIVLGLFFLGMVAVWLYLGDAPIHSVLRAKKIQILTAEGRQAITLDSDRIGGRIAIRFNQTTEPPPPAVFIYAAREGGALQLYPPGENFFALSAKVDEKGNGKINLRGRGLQKGVQLKGPATPEEGGSLQIYDGSGEVTVAFPNAP